MIGDDPGHDQRKLSPDELDEIRNSWGCGVPLQLLATQHGVTENELRRQLGIPPRRAPEPPAGERGLIRPEHLEQMRRRKEILTALRNPNKGRGDE